MPEISSDEMWIITSEEVRAYRQLEWALNAAVIGAALVFFFAAWPSTGNGITTVREFRLYSCLTPRGQQ